MIVCPKCGMAKGVKANKKTTSCQCGREIDMSRVKIMFLTDSPMELAESVARANAALRGGEQLPREKKARSRSPYALAAESAKSAKDPLERLRIIAQELTRLKSGFAIEDLRKVASILGKNSADDMLARMLEHNMVYEAGEGVYRSV